MNLAMLLDLPANIVPEQAIITSDGTTSSYAELREGAARAAALLDHEGVGPGDRIATFGVNSQPLVEVLFGAAARGITAAPLNYRAREREAAHMLADSGARLVFADSRYREMIERVRPASLERIILLDDDYGDLCAGSAPAFEVSFEVEDDDIAMLIYTSGTTSLPKGVQLTHGALSSFVLTQGDVADGSDRGATLLSVPLYHVAGLTTLLVSIYAGRRIVLMPQFEVEGWLSTVESERPTHAFLVPTMLAKLLEAEAFEAADLSSLQAISYGAAPMPSSLLRRILERFPERIDFSGAYGLSETTSTVAVLGPEDHRLGGADAEARLKRLSSVGRPIAGVEIEIRSASGEPLPHGEVGEVHIRTPRAMAGYLGDPGEAPKAVRAEDGALGTGDLGYLDEEGYLFLVGRSSQMIIRGGENIAPAEIEDVLHAHPDVVEAGVVGLQDEEWGEIVAAAVVLRENAAAGEAELREHCAVLASFKRPEVITIVDELPRTSTGKLIDRELAGLLDAARGAAVER